MVGLEAEAESSTPIIGSLNSPPQLSWPDLSATSRFIRRSGWEHRSLPSELTRTPDGIVIPEALQKILSWSLIPGTNWSYQELKTPTKEHPSHPTESKSDKPSVLSAPATNAGVLTPNSSTDNVSNSTYKSTIAHRGPSPVGDRSLKSKLLSKMRRGKKDETNAPVVVKEVSSSVAECTSCFEELPEVEMTRLKSCRHWYCKVCLAALITTAISAEATFPPKCCLSPIPLKQVLKALDVGQRERYQEKAAEYATPAPDRWYCPDKDCLKWIPKSRLKLNKDLGYDCPHCAIKLCRTCRGAAHAEGTECPQDFGLEATLETAEIEGWQRCYKCRALVEHNRGCRHMTCRCSAEFCYVCGLRWQTCACTETDAANKRAGVEARRQAHAIEVDEEAAEIAHAIAEVEEMERREAEERQREELRYQQEVADQLQWLEAERLAEEQKRREEAEQAEREFRRTLVRSYIEEWNQLEELYYKVVTYQANEIRLRHEREDQKLSTMNVQDEADAKKEFEAISLILERNVARRRTKLEEKHKTDLTDLEARQETEEDDIFLQVQMRLRGKSNKESRMERMLAEIHKQQEEDRKELETRQQTELSDFQQKLSIDTTGLQKWHDHRICEARDRRTIALQKFGFAVGADRQYFELVTERRNRMLAQHAQSCMNSLKVGEGPIGLTEYEASQIQPSLPEFDDGEQGSSGIQRGSSSAAAPANISTPTPSMDNRFYAQQQSLVSIEDPNQHNNSAPAPAPVTTISSSHYSPLLPQRRPLRPPIPGSFPTDIQTPRIYQPPPPSTNPPPIPPSLLPTLPSTPQPTTPHPTITTPRTRRYIPPPQPVFQDRLSINTNTNTWNPTPGPRWHNTPNANYKVQSAMSTIVSVGSSIATTDLGTSTSTGTGTDAEHNRRISNVSEVSTATGISTSTGPAMTMEPLTSKKSRWFKRKEIGEEEIRRSMVGTVGDASFSGMGGRAYAVS